VTGRMLLNLTGRRAESVPPISTFVGFVSAGEHKSCYVAGACCGEGGMIDDLPHAEVRLNVLVVDDQADSADAVAFMLSLMGHDVHTAYGPREALELFRELQPSVVLMDISMPELSGLEAAARIRSLPEGTSTTIIALTGLGHEQDRRRSREASIDHHLVKPASPAVLHRLLSAIHPAQ
jgi:CheY-like chemotaxis protein